MEDLSETTCEKTCVMLVGNKKDLEDKREVTHEEALALASKYGVEYIECSAKTGENIENAFTNISRAMKKQFIDSCDPVACRK